MYNLREITDHDHGFLQNLHNDPEVRNNLRHPNRFNTTYVMVGQD